MANKPIRVEMTLEFEVHQDGDLYISRCESLDLYSQGYSEDEAHANLAEAAGLFIESCMERGVLAQVLRESGVQVNTKYPQDAPTSSSLRELKIPFPLTEFLGAQAHAY